jgi:hypothetical protein
MQSCKSVCERFKVNYKQYWASNRCIICRHWFEKEVVQCPCCHTLLRTKPKTYGKYRKI